MVGENQPGRRGRWRWEPRSCQEGRKPTSEFQGVERNPREKTPSQGQRMTRRARCHPNLAVGTVEREGKARAGLNGKLGQMRGSFGRS